MLNGERAIVYATPLSTTSVPQNVTVEPLDRSMKITWQAPEVDNGANVLKYKVYVNGVLDVELDGQRRFAIFLWKDIAQEKANLKVIGGGWGATKSLCEAGIAVTLMHAVYPTGKTPCLTPTGKPFEAGHNSSKHAVIVILSLDLMLPHYHIDISWTEKESYSIGINNFISL